MAWFRVGRAVQTFSGLLGLKAWGLGLDCRRQTGLGQGGGRRATPCPGFARVAEAVVERVQAGGLAGPPGHGALCLPDPGGRDQRDLCRGHCLDHGHCPCRASGRGPRAGDSSPGGHRRKGARSKWEGEVRPDRGEPAEAGCTCTPAEVGIPGSRGLRNRGRPAPWCRRPALCTAPRPLRVGWWMVSWADPFGAGCVPPCAWV